MEGYSGTRRRRAAMMRLVLSIVAALLFGVIATVTVSWGFAMRPGSSATLNDIGNEWVLRPPTGWPSHPLAGYDCSFRGALQRRRWIDAVTNDTSEPVTFHQLIWATGWPWPALCCEHRSAPGDDQRWLDFATQGQPPIEGWHDAFIIDPTALQRGAKAIPGLPLRPVWPGFGLGVLLYASLAWLLLYLPLVLRTQARRRRGACLHCGHQRLAGATRCPECGRDDGDANAPSAAADSGAATGAAGAAAAPSSASHSTTLLRT